MKRYKTIEKECSIEYKIERSRFIGYASPCNSTLEAKEFVVKIKKMHSLATHNCYAYLIKQGENATKFFDDGEPQGTAGMPILEGIKSFDLTNVCVVVTRYFGGIKLGAGGLTRAYLKSATLTLESATIIEKVLVDLYEVTVSYEEYSGLLSAFQKEIVNVEYLDNVKITFAIEKDEKEGFQEKINSLLLKCVDLNFLKEEYV